MSEPFVGEIRPFGFNFAPRGWATCSGQILSIEQNTALFALIGTTFGGDGQTTFALPDLRGRVAVGADQGPGLPDVQLGEVSGTETETLLLTQIPVHTHAAAVSTAPATTHQASGNFPAKSARKVFADIADGAGGAGGSAGGSQPHNNMQPYLTINFCIALDGIFPSRN